MIYGDTIKILAVDLYSEGNISRERIELLSIYDGILMHDHETVMYHFGNGHAECSVHLLRYLRKNSEDTGNAWSTDMIRLLTDADNRRKELSEK